MIYFIRGKDSGNIKIGYSINPEKRQSNLQTAHYEELELIGFMNGTLDDETRIHQMFAAYNIRGEWYRSSDEILDFIETNTTKPQTNVVAFLGNNEYRITFAEPIRFTLKFLLWAGTHDIRVLTDRDTILVFGIEGKRGILLDWLKSLEVVSQRAIDKFALLTTPN